MENHRLIALWTYDEVLTALGGPRGVSKITGQPAHAASTWRKQRGKFPTRYYFCMKAALADAGFRAPISLWGFHTAADEFRGPRQAA